MFTIEYWVRSFFGWLQRPRKRFGQFVGWWPWLGPILSPCHSQVAFFHFLGEVFWLWNMCKWGFIPWISGEIGDGLSMFIVGFSILSTDTIGFGDSHLAAKVFCVTHLWCRWSTILGLGHVTRTHVTSPATSCLFGQRTVMTAGLCVCFARTIGHLFPEIFWEWGTPQIDGWQLFPHNKCNYGARPVFRQT